jgi:MFS family permease
MSAKWRTYFITLFTYAVIHAIRTMWSAIKSNLSEPPFNYEVSFLGTMDMVLLFVIAIFMSIFGRRVEEFGAKKAMIITLSALIFFNTLVGIFLNLNFTSKWIYICVFGLGIGISSCVAWPSCLYVILSFTQMVSIYFDKRKGLALSAWNGTSQLGDFISLITFFIIVASH